MNIIKTENKFCFCCMKNHDISLVESENMTFFKGIEITYPILYEYCNASDEYYEPENLLQTNDISMKNAYRRKIGLLTSEEITAIRKKYDISQTDLAIILGWGEKTITRYESHQVQDFAHDAILKKIDEDPEWFLRLIENAINKIPSAAYERYCKIASNLFEAESDEYLKKTIEAQYIKFKSFPSLCGNKSLDLNKVVDAIHFLVDNLNVNSLQKAILIKALWYSDAFCFGNTGHTLTGLVYRVKLQEPVPVQDNLIFSLSDFEEYSILAGKGWQNHAYSHLSEDEKVMLLTVAESFSGKNEAEILDIMNLESAMKRTAENDYFSFDSYKTTRIS